MVLRCRFDTHCTIPNHLQAYARSLYAVIVYYSFCCLVPIGLSEHSTAEMFWSIRGVCSFAEIRGLTGATTGVRKWTGDNPDPLLRYQSPRYWKISSRLDELRKGIFKPEGCWDRPL